MTWLAEGLIVLAGVAIGATSIGGVLVVPVLSGVAGVPLAGRLPLQVWRSFRPGCSAGVPRVPRPGNTARRGCCTSRHCRVLLCGALLVYNVPTAGVDLWLAALAATSGLYGLASLVAAQGERPMPGAAVLAVLGFAVGLGSALSGTGGPVLLLPLLLLRRTAMAPALAAALAVQLPIALAASAAHWVGGHLPLALGLKTGVMVTAGVLAGRLLARKMPVQALRASASLCLLAVASWVRHPMNT
ncbi:TSUP family transporter [Cupriavidus basilensis]